MLPDRGLVARPDLQLPGRLLHPGGGIVEVAAVLLQAEGTHGLVDQQVQELKRKSNSLCCQCYNDA